MERTRLRPAFDALSLTAVRHELERLILGGGIQRIELYPRELVLEVYAHQARRRLTCHVGDDSARIHLTVLKSEPTPSAESQLLLQLRKHVRGGRIVAIRQPRLERILELEIVKRDDGETRSCSLIIETMGRRSNAILVDEGGLILDAFRRTPPSRSPGRPILPHLAYRQPPPQTRTDPGDADLADALIRASLEAPPRTTAAELLSRTMAGCSPLTAQEIVFRSLGSAKVNADMVADWPSVANAAQALFGEIDRGVAAPHVAFIGEEPAAATAFRPDVLAAEPDIVLRSFDSMSEALETAFGMQRAVSTGVSRGAQDVVRRIRQVLEQEHRRESALTREVAQAEEIDLLRQYGEAILASLGTIQPGDTQIEFNGLTVPLAPPRTPVEVANGYFSDYRKRRDAAEQVPLLRAASAQRVEYLESLIAMAEANDAQAAHRQILRELDTFIGAPSVQSKKRQSRQEPQPKRFTSPDGRVVLVGTNGTMNDRITFKVASPDDVWLHARGEPGAHVILRTAGREPSGADLQFAANLAARFSRARTSADVPVDHTLVRHVRKIRGAPPGLVHYVHERTIRGRAEAASLDRM